MPADATPLEIRQTIHEVRQQVGRVVVGYDAVVEDLLMGYMTEGHVILEGVPGIAKTTLAKTFARALGLSFERIQFAPDVLPADITGHFYYNQKEAVFEVRKGPVFANVVLADEINRAGAKTQAALLEAMQEAQVTIEGKTFPLPRPFFVIATQNPVDVEGVYTLPVAQLDRFMFRSRLDYLPRAGERDVLLRKIDGTLERDGRLARDSTPAKVLRNGHETIHVDPTVVDYVLDIVYATRSHPALRLGASTRAAEHMVQAARARGLLEGRRYVIPDDVKRIAPNVLGHRLLLSVDAELEQRNSTDILAEILNAVPIPLVEAEAEAR